MKRGSLRLIGFYIFVLLLITPSIFADDVTLNLESRVVESFDKPDGWAVKGSKFVTEGFPTLKYVDAWPEALHGANKEGADYKVLGVNAKYNRKGYNAIEVYPVNADGTPRGIPLPGRVQLIDLWVWGSNYDYYLEIHIKDFKGISHVLHMGSLVYEGWKNLKAKIPSYIPQSRSYIPKFEGLQITKVVIWTRPEEKVDDFYVYFDQLKILTDVFITRFDGDELASPETSNEIWNTGAGGVAQ